MATAVRLRELYDALLARFGPQHWWPAESPFEMMLGAVLVQNTNWENVVRALDNLRRPGWLDPGTLYRLSVDELAAAIRPAGYYNIKAKRLRNLLTWLHESHGGSVERLADAYAGKPPRTRMERLREQLLEVSGVGRETADCILLYGLGLPTFVVDAYTHRVLLRHRLIDADADYETMRELFMSALPEDIPMWQEYHALLVAAGKHHCKPTPRCTGCPLEPFPHDDP